MGQTRRRVPVYFKGETKGTRSPPKAPHSDDDDHHHIEDVQEKNWMVTGVTITIRYVIALQKEHISIVQGFEYDIPRNPAVCSLPNMTRQKS